MLAPNQVKNYQFQPVGDGLYRAEEVESFVQTVGDAYERLFREHGELLKRVSLLAEKVKEYQEEEELIKKTLLVAQKKADEIESAARQYSETAVANADKRSRDLTAATEERARAILDNANRESSAILKSARETAEKTEAASRSRAAALLSEAKARAEKLLAEARRKHDEAVGSLAAEVQRESEALGSARAQSKTFKAQILQAYQEQIRSIESLLSFADSDDSIAADAAAAVQQIVSQPVEAEPIELDLTVDTEPAEETPAEAAAEEPSTYLTDEDDLFISTYAETVSEEAEETPAQEPVAEPASETPAEDGGFTFGDLDTLVPSAARSETPEQGHIQ